MTTASLAPTAVQASVALSFSAGTYTNHVSITLEIRNTRGTTWNGTTVDTVTGESVHGRVLYAAGWHGGGGGILHPANRAWFGVRGDTNSQIVQKHSIINTIKIGDPVVSDLDKGWIADPQNGYYRSGNGSFCPDLTRYDLTFSRTEGWIELRAILVGLYCIFIE
jgi:hypothetical protein